MTDWGNIYDAVSPENVNEAQRIAQPASSAYLFPSHAAHMQDSAQRGIDPLSKQQYWSGFRADMKKFVESPVRKDVFNVLRRGKVPYSSNYYGPGRQGVDWIDPVTKQKGFTPHEATRLRINPSLKPLGKKQAVATGGVGAAVAGAKALLGAPAVSAFATAPVTSAALVAGAGLAGYGAGRLIGKTTGLDQKMRHFGSFLSRLRMRNKNVQTQAQIERLQALRGM